jgi:hypothetical protein
MSKIGTLTGGATTTISLNFIPEIIELEDGAVISSLVVETTDYGVILNLDANGVTSMGKLEQFGAVSATLKFPLATGQLPLNGQSCRITATLAAGADREIYQRSTRGITAKDGAIIRTSISQALQNSEIIFDKFSYLGLFNVGTSDILNLVYENNHVETSLDIRQVQAMLVEQMGGVTAPDLNTVLSPSVLDNTNGTFRKVTLIPSGGNRNIYVRRLQNIQAITQR